MLHKHVFCHNNIFLQADVLITIIWSKKFIFLFVWTFLKETQTFLIKEFQYFHSKDKHRKSDPPRSLLFGKQRKPFEIKKIF